MTRFIVVVVVGCSGPLACTPYAAQQLSEAYQQQSARQAQVDAFNAEHQREMARMKSELDAMERNRRTHEEAEEQARPENQRAAEASRSAASSSPSSPPSPRLVVFGGPEHRTFLGCVCSEYDPDSITNQYGHYGRFATDSLWNHFGNFGSSFSTFSACSQFAQDPPVVVDFAGNFYGRLTLNEFAQGAITDERVVAWLKAVVCAP